MWNRRKVFAKERSFDSKHFHMNRYALDSDNNEVLMTKDHIIPASKGGKNHISNFQTMCTDCNFKKGVTIE